MIDRLPTTVEIDGKDYPIRSNFYIGIKMDNMIHDPEVKGYELITRALSLYYTEIPHNLEQALEKLIWFYACGEPTESNEKSERAYSFEVDDRLIYAAFLDQYGIDLCEIKYLHWWKFMGLFEGLREDHRIVQIMGYRLKKIDRKMPKAERDFYADMKRRYALETTKKRITLAERDKQMKDYVKRRLEVKR